MDIMKKLFNGKIYPSEQLISDSDDYRTAMRKLDALMQRIEETVDSETIGLVNELLDLYAVIDDCQQLECFKYGLSMGLELTREANSILRKK